MADESKTKKILIIEDDANLAKLVKEELEGEGFSIDVAIDGEQAIEKIEYSPDLILLDIMLPKVDGLTVLKNLREKNAWGAHVPVIIMSNLSPDSPTVLSYVNTFEPVYYLVKADMALSDVKEKVKSILAQA
jgi:two-component system, OmpR family, alkaline phosphatase synthesis response regulator PhoP